MHARLLIVAAVLAAPAAALGQAPPASASAPAERTTILQFEERLARERAEKYRHPTCDVVAQGFRPIGGQVADFAAIRGPDGRLHVFYIERRLQEGTPFYPGHEIYLGHASTADLLTFEVHEPVMLVRPGTWEEAHVWAPSIIKHDGRYVMAYTGLNRHLSQDIGLAASRDLFDWQRLEGNPLGLARGKSWAAWWPDRISSCRDPHLFAHEGRFWMAYTANTREGAACVALCSSPDLRQWTDLGPILIGPAEGYEPNPTGGHTQGSLESPQLVFRAGAWRLIFKAAVRGTKTRNWMVSSPRIDRFDFAARQQFWPGALGVEVLADHGSRSLLATFGGGCLRFGLTDWAAGQPTGQFVTSAEQLAEWRGP